MVIDELEAKRNAKSGSDGVIARLLELKEQEPILRFFNYDHLPERLQAISAEFAAVAGTICGLPRSAERTVALRKLLESKDAAVRAAL